MKIRPTQREKIEYPKIYKDWKNLPTEFQSYLDELDARREELERNSQTLQDPLYPSYEYSFSLDEDIAIQTILIYWNADEPLPSNDVILDEIIDCMAENDYDAYVSSLYSY